MTEVVDIFLKFSILLLNQCLVKFSISNFQLQTMVLTMTTFAVLTSILTFAFVISKILQIPKYTSDGLTLLLYMYTDAVNEIIKNLDVGYAGAVVFGSVYLILAIYSNEENDDNTSIIQYFTRASNMVSVNVIIQNTVQTYSESNLYVICTLLIFILYILDCCESASVVFQESRNFALWRSAQTLYELYSTVQSDSLFSLLVFAMIWTVKIKFSSSKTRKSWYTMTELFTLIAVNALLGVISDNILQIGTFYQVSVLLLYVVLIHYATEELLQWC